MFDLCEFLCFHDFLTQLGVLFENLGDIVACGVRSKQVTSVEFSACSAATADFAILAVAASAFEVVLVS